MKKKRFLIFPGLCFIIFLSSCLFLKAGEGVYIKCQGRNFLLGNKYLQRTLEVKNGILRTTEIRNKITGKALKVISDEFSIKINDNLELTDRDFQLVHYQKTHLQKGGKRLGFWLKNKKYSTQIKVYFELHPNDFYLHKWLVLYGQPEVTVNSLEVERFKAKGNLYLGGFGQPIFIDNMFFLGLEYPAGYNERQKGGIISLRHYPGRKLSSEPYQSKRAALGVSPKGKIEDWFMKYIWRIRRQPRSFLVYNSWYDIQGKEVNEANLIDRFEVFKRELYYKHQIALDSMVIDDGWQSRQSIWEYDKTKFPHGFAPLAKKFQETKTNLGLWLPLTAHKYNLDTQWGEAQGYEVSPGGGFFCLSGPKYQKALKEILKRYIKEYQVNYFKHDFNSFDCRSDKHTHLPGQFYGTEANVDAEIRLFQFIRSLKPDIYLNPSGGMWLSPWWLMYVDTVWMQYCDDFGYDKSVFAPEPRDWEMTYRDGKIWMNLQRDRLQFPVSAVMTIGIIYGKLNMLGGEKEPLDKWTDNIILNLGRGSMLKELYITPNILTEAQWDILAKALKWAKENADILMRGKMILGNPSKGEAYGYSHFRDTYGIICLRNPSLKRQKVQIKLNVLNQAKRYLAEITYPYRKVLGTCFQAKDAFNLELGPYELQIIEILPLGALREPIIENCRYCISEKKPGLMVCELWAEPGTKQLIQITAPGQLKEVIIDGKRIAGRGRKNLTCRIEFPGQKSEIEAKDLTSETDRKHLTNKVKVNLPESVDKEPKFILLFEQMGKTVPIKEIFVNRQKATTYEYQGDKWKAFLLPLSLKENIIRWSLFSEEEIALPFQTKRFIMTPWLLAKENLAKKQITIKYKPLSRKDKPKADLPTPFAGLAPKSIQIQAPKILDTGIGQKKVVLKPQDLRNITAAKLHINIFGSQGDEFLNKPMIFNGVEIGNLPINQNPTQPDYWEEKIIDIPKDKLSLIRQKNYLIIKNLSGDCFKVTDIALAVQLPDGNWVETNQDNNIYSSVPGWPYTEGKVFSKGISPPIILTLDSNS